MFIRPPIRLRDPLVLAALLSGLVSTAVADTRPTLAPDGAATPGRDRIVSSAVLVAQAPPAPGAWAVSGAPPVNGAAPGSTGAAANYGAPTGPGAVRTPATAGAIPGTDAAGTDGAGANTAAAIRRRLPLAPTDAGPPSSVFPGTSLAPVPFDATPGRRAAPSAAINGPGLAPPRGSPDAMTPPRSPVLPLPGVGR